MGSANCNSFFSGCRKNEIHYNCIFGFKTGTPASRAILFHTSLICFLHSSVAILDMVLVSRFTKFPPLRALLGSLKSKVSWIFLPPNEKPIRRGRTRRLNSILRPPSFGNGGSLKADALGNDWLQCNHRALLRMHPCFFRVASVLVADTIRQFHRALQMNCTFALFTLSYRGTY